MALIVMEKDLSGGIPHSLFYCDFGRCVKCGLDLCADFRAYKVEDVEPLSLVIFYKYLKKSFEEDLAIDSEVRSEGAHPLWTQLSLS